MSEIAGTVRWQDDGISGASVVLLDLGAGRIVDQRVTAEDGAFTLADTGVQQGLVVAVCGPDPLGVVGSTASGTDPLVLRLDRAGTFHPLTVRVEADADTGPPPAALELTLDAERIDAVPESWLAVTRMPVGGTVHSGLATLPLTDGHARTRVQAGRWLLSAQHVVAFAANAPGLEPEASWLTIAATADGRPLDPAPWGIGFAAEIQAPTTVVLRVAPIRR